MDSRVIGAIGSNHYDQMLTLLTFTGADRIEYIDHGNGEDYILTKAGDKITLKARGNKCEGGFLCVDFGQPPAKLVD